MVYPTEEVRLKYTKEVIYDLTRKVCVNKIQGKIQYVWIKVPQNSNLVSVLHDKKNNDYYKIFSRNTSIHWVTKSM